MDKNEPNKLTVDTKKKFFYIKFILKTIIFIK